MGGEVEVFVKDGNLMLRGLFGPGAKAFPIFRKDAADPLLYQGLLEKMLITILFEADEEGRVNRLSMSGVNVTLYKRPLKQSLRFIGFTAAGALAGVALLGLSKLFCKRK